MQSGFQKEYIKQTAVYVPGKVISSLQREFDVTDDDINSFITNLIERVINDKIAQNNSKIFSESEVKEIEDDLKGLGYI